MADRITRFWRSIPIQRFAGFTEILLAVAFYLTPTKGVIGELFNGYAFPPIAVATVFLAAGLVMLFYRREEAIFVSGTFPLCVYALAGAFIMLREETTVPSSVPIVYLALWVQFQILYAWEEINV